VAWAVLRYPGFSRVRQRVLTIESQGLGPITMTSFNVLSPLDCVRPPSRVCSQRWRLNQDTSAPTGNLAPSARDLMIASGGWKWALWP